MDTTRLAHLVDKIHEHSFTLACAESLTGGQLAGTVVNIPGVSEIFRGGIVSYATDVKASVLGVSRERLDLTGPVDEQVAIQMARGACRVLNADIGISTTGVAGPGPHDGHPAGTVWIGIAGVVGEKAELYHFDGDRVSVRAQAVNAALELLEGSVLRLP